MTDLTIYLITRNRPQMALRALKSILSQTFKNFTLIISDNSTNNNTRIAIDKEGIKDNRIKYVVRNPTFVSGIDHMTAIHDENISPYYMVFHDDDEMCSEMVEKLYNAIISNDGIIATACNAYLVVNNKIKYRREMFHERNIQVLTKKEEMLHKYIDGGIAPFPSYMYNKKLVGHLQMNKNYGGKYCDSAFIISLLDSGKIIYLPQHLMFYYRHNGQYSYQHEFTQWLSLIKFYQTIVPKNKLRNIRIYNIYRERVRRCKDNKLYLYSKKIMCLLLLYSWKNYFPKYVLRILHMYNK